MGRGSRGDTVEGGCAIDASVFAAHLVSERRTWEGELARCSGLKGAEGRTNLESPGGVVVSPGQRVLQACTDASAARIRDWSPRAAWRGRYAGPRGQRCGCGAGAGAVRACDLRLPLLYTPVTTPTGRRGSRVVVEVGSFSKRRPGRHGQRWSRNVKGAGSATGDMLYNIEPATIVEQRTVGGRGASSLAAMHHLPTWNPAVAASTRAAERETETHKAAVVVVSACGGLRTPIR